MGRRGKATAKTSPERITFTKNATRALKLREQGLSLEDIGQQLGVTAQRVFAILKKAIGRLVARQMECAEHVQVLELRRLDSLLAVAMPKAQQGDMKAVSTVLQIMERRARLLGLDLADKPSGPAKAPTTLTLNIVEVSVPKEITNGHDGRTLIEDHSAARGPAEILQE